MRKYDNVCLTQDVIPRVTDPDKGYIKNDQGISTVQLYLSYTEGQPESISYFWDLMCGWNKINNISIHDTRDTKLDDDIVGMDLYRKKLSRIRSHVKHSITLCGRVGATDYIRRVASIGERSTALLQFHKDALGGSTWIITDCRNKVHYYRSSGEKILMFLEGLVRVLDRNITEFDKFRKYVRNDIHRTHIKKGDVDTPDHK